MAPRRQRRLRRKRKHPTSPSPANRHRNEKFTDENMTWPGSKISASQIQSMYEASKQAGPQPFLQTGLGQLAPELRQQIYSNLLATPPPYGGRDFRSNQAPTVGRPPISLTSFVNLKASCLEVLQTCRQIYLEAFPVFYAGKSYYLANSKDLAQFSRFGGYRKIGPRTFRFDTIISLCLKDLVLVRPMWTPEDIDSLMSERHTFVREELEQELNTDLDDELVLVDLREMTSLRKICLCMRVGQEWQYLKFLFRIRGFRRGVIDFVDNFHWSIRRQRLFGEDWNLQYSAFYMRGKSFERLDYDDVDIQGEMLNIDSRASDLAEGDERWVEVEIGSRDYDDDRMSESQDVLNTAEGQVSTNQQNAVDPPTDDESDYESEQLQGGEERGTQIDDERGHEPDDLQEQPVAEEQHTQPDNNREHQPGDQQRQPDEEDHGARTDLEPDQESGNLQSLEEDNGHRFQAASDANHNSETSQGSRNIGASTRTVPESVSENLQDLIIVKYGNAPTETEPSKELEDSVASLDNSFTYVQTETDIPKIPQLAPEEGKKDVLDAQTEEKTQGTTEISTGTPYENDYDSQTQTEQMEPASCSAENQTEPGKSANRMQMEYQITIVTSQDVTSSNQNVSYQSQAPDEQRVPAPSMLKPSERFQGFAETLPETRMAEKSPEKLKDSPVHQKSFQAPGNLQTRRSSEMPSAKAENYSKSEVKRKLLLGSDMSRRLHGCVRAAALVLALSLIYVFLYAKVENTLGQMLALHLFVLLLVVATWSEND